MSTQAAAYKMVAEKNLEDVLIKEKHIKKEEQPAVNNLLIKTSIIFY